ncbi:hypothetical protein NC651_039803 [Populus alba x Populus x berolinensis]|nr:hypothetical protein NC651_039803 [Populus alba x Populus x berolinensis]
MDAAATGINVQNFHSKDQEGKPPSIIPIKVQESSVRIETTETTTVAGLFVQRLFRALFFVHILLIAILVICLAIRGLLSSHCHNFHPKKWYPPLLAATACAGIVAFTWQWFPFRNPSRALRAAFWLSPLLTCAVGVLFVLISSTASLTIGVIAIVLALILSLYACWVNSQFDYATKVLSVAAASPPAKTTTLINLSIILSNLYSCFLVSGIGGATAVGTVVDTSFIVVILASLAWSTQVMKNTLQVTIARIKYLHFASGADMDSRIALRDTIKYSMGSVCISSVLVPIITVIRGSARAISLIAGGTDEFLFSCANCYSAVAATLVNYGNRWGLVQVGVYNKGFVQASMDTWEMLRRVGLEPIIDRDLTGSFCFLCGTAGGAICTLVGGELCYRCVNLCIPDWLLHGKRSAISSCRIAMAWQQSCVAAYYIAYAENPENPQLDPTILFRIQEFQRRGA